MKLIHVLFYWNYYVVDNICNDICEFILWKNILFLCELLLEFCGGIFVKFNCGNYSLVGL